MRFLSTLPIMLVLVALPGAARAVDTAFAPAKTYFTETPLPDEQAFSDDKPVALTADRVDYLQQEDVVMATGHVEIVQGDTMVLAQKVVYDRTNGIVTASGDVSIMDSTGSVMFADEAELRDDLSRGVIEQFKARFADDSLFASARAVRVNEDVLELDRAVYSPCKVKCAEDLAPGEEPRDPLWQLRAKHVTIDQQEQTIVYDDAWMEVYGLPVFYTPYLSHATPNADGKSGLMVPEVERSRNLGNVYRVPYYYAIAPDRDATIIPVYTSQEGWLLRGMYRQQFDNGLWDLDSSITRPRDRDALGNLSAGRQWRGHLYTTGNFNVDDDTRWGFDIKRSTDDTYLRKYEIDGDTLLTSRVYSESYDFLTSSTRNSFTADAIAFQGLALTDNSDRIPLILPLLNFEYQSDPGIYGSRYFANSNVLSLTRDIGSQSRRFSNTVGWKLPYIDSSGQVIELSTQLRGDIYNVSDVLLSSGKNYDGTTGRLVPEASVLWRYPFINQMNQGSVTIEPVVNMALSPNGGNPETIPNEDSLVPEFTDTNLFSTNRFAGYDRIEHGPRVSYGLRGLVNYQKTYVDWLLGQHYRVEEDRNFPFSNDVTDNLSDYVGKLGMQWNPLYIAYRFRLDKESLSPRRSEVDLTYAARRLTFTASYLSLQNDPVFASREEVVASAMIDLHKNWAFNTGVRRDLEIDQLTSLGAELIFKNECVNISGVVNREYTRDREVKPDTRYLLRVSFKNLN